MTTMKVRDRENRKLFTGFRDMADFHTENWDPIPSLVGPYIVSFHWKFDFKKSRGIYIGNQGKRHF